MAKHIHKSQTHPFVKEDLTATVIIKVPKGLGGGLVASHKMLDVKTQ
jgi:hypothetical protein